MTTKAKLQTAPLKMLLDRILVLPDPPPDKIGSIVVPDSAKDDAKKTILYGTAISVGKDVTEVQPGQRVVYQMYGEERCGMNVMLNGVEHLVMREEDIMGTLSE